MSAVLVQAVVYCLNTMHFADTLGNRKTETPSERYTANMVSAGNLQLVVLA